MTYLFPSSWEQEHSVEKRLCKFEAEDPEFVTFLRHWSCWKEVGKQVMNIVKTLKLEKLLLIKRFEEKKTKLEGTRKIKKQILFILFLLECFYKKPIIMLCFSCVCFNSSLFLDRSFSSIPSPKLQNKSYFIILCTTRSSHDCSSYCWLIRPFWSKTRLKMLRCAALCLFVCY